MKHFDIFIIGAGAAGIAAAKSAWMAGCRSIAIADRKNSMGGILLQCAHRGFGSDRNGTEYAHDLLVDFPTEITIYHKTTAISVSADRTAVLSGVDTGIQQIHFDQLILASGCREIPLGALPISGTRPQGIYTAGHMQELMNIHHQIPEGPVVILGSGDIGLIMANHLAEAGVKVAGIVEKNDTCGGMQRNQVRIEPYHLPFYFNNTVVKISGYPHLEGVTLTDGTYIPCRTLLAAIGLVPDQELIHDLGMPDWIHICGNAHHVHPMVEGVVMDGEKIGMEVWTQIRKA